MAAMDDGHDNVGLVDFYEVDEANEPKEDFNNEEPPPPPELRSQNASCGPRIRTVMNHTLPPILQSSGLSVLKLGRHTNIGVITCNVATFNCHETYTQAVGEEIWVQQYENGLRYKTLICERLPGLMPAPVPAPVPAQVPAPVPY